MVDVTPADPNVPGSADRDPADVNRAAVTQLPQRVGAPGVTVPPALPKDVHAPAVTYHTPSSSAGSNTPHWGGEHGHSGSFVAPMAGGVEGGGEGQSVTTTIPAPTIGTATGAGTGGTLAAGTYYYKVTATTEAGETTPSGEVSATTTGTTSKVTVTWSEVDDAQTTGYKIYRGTSAGAENKLVGTVAKGTMSFVDTGSAGTTVTLPGSNTSASAFPTRTNAGGTHPGHNPYPRDVNAPAVTVPPAGGW